MGALLARSRRLVHEVKKESELATCRSAQWSFLPFTLLASLQTEDSTILLVSRRLVVHQTWWNLSMQDVIDSIVSTPFLIPSYLQLLYSKNQQRILSQRSLLGCSECGEGAIARARLNQGITTLSFKFTFHQYNDG